MKRKATQREAARAIVQRLRDQGHEALFAGGCVRDLVLNREPKDYDIATDAVPQRVTELFPGAQQVGAQFGVVLIRHHGHAIEIATFRSDGEYQDGRHPASVTFSNPEEDALRRDFTINGMFYDPLKDRIIDYVGGQEDLRHGVIRAIGSPDARFGEDRLRMLRAARFAARFSFEVEPATAAAIRQSANYIRQISPERIRMELTMILTAPSRGLGWELLYDLGLANEVLENTAWTEQENTATRHRLEQFGPVECSEPLAWAAVFIKFGAVGAAERCRQLRCSNQNERDVRWLVTQLPRAAVCSEFELADFKLIMAHERFNDLLQLLEADVLAGKLGDAPLRAWRDHVAMIEPERIAPPPLVTGDDLIGMGLQPGPEFSRILIVVYRCQLNEEFSDRDSALTQARQVGGLAGL